MDIGRSCCLLGMVLAGEGRQAMLAPCCLLVQTLGDGGAAWVLVLEGSLVAGYGIGE